MRQRRALRGGLRNLNPFGRWASIIAVVFLSIVGVAGLSSAIYAAWLFHDMPKASYLVDYHPPTATRVYGWDGTLIGEYSTERRIYVPFDQIPPHVYLAFLAAEDHSFFRHGGVDVFGVGRALIKDVFNVAQGKRPEGGSTVKPGPSVAPIAAAPCSSETPSRSPISVRSKRRPRPNTFCAA